MSTPDEAAYAELRALMAETAGTPRPAPAYEHNRFVWVFDDLYDKDDALKSGGYVVIHDGGNVYNCRPRTYKDGETLREKTIAALRKRGWQEYRITTGYQFGDPCNEEWPEFLAHMGQLTTDVLAMAHDAERMI